MTDWLLAVWIVLSGAAFIICPITGWFEPVGGSYVYAAVVVVCLTNALLGVIRRLFESYGRS